MSDMLISQTYAYELQNEEPSNYTRIPNILSHLTYDYVDVKTGKTEVRRLSLCAKELYRVIKMIAGDKGACWMTAENLAKECGMSKGSVHNAKEELQQKFHQLDGNPLVIIHERKNSFKKNDKCVGKSSSHVSTVTDIWKWNRAFMITKKMIKKEARSPHDRENEARSPHDQAPEGARSPRDPNKNTNNKNHLSKEQQPAAVAAPVVSLDQSVDLFPSEDQNRAYRWFLRWQCPEKTARQFVLNYTIEDLHLGTQYLEKQIKKSNKVIENKWAYLRTTLDRKYWLNKVSA